MRTFFHCCELYEWSYGCCVSVCCCSSQNATHSLRSVQVSTKLLLAHFTFYSNETCDSNPAIWLYMFGFIFIYHLSFLLVSRFAGTQRFLFKIETTAEHTDTQAKMCIRSRGWNIKHSMINSMEQQLKMFVVFASRITNSPSERFSIRYFNL